MLMRKPGNPGLPRGLRPFEEAARDEKQVYILLGRLEVRRGKMPDIGGLEDAAIQLCESRPARQASAEAKSGTSTRSNRRSRLSCTTSAIS